MISVAECKNGFLYRIKSRNAHYGIWDAQNQNFITAREKFGIFTLECDQHKEIGRRGATAIPVQEIEEVPKGYVVASNDKLLFYLRKWETTNSSI